MIDGRKNPTTLYIFGTLKILDTDTVDFKATKQTNTTSTPFNDFQQSKQHYTNKRHELCTVARSVHAAKPPQT